MQRFTFFLVLTLLVCLTLCSTSAQTILISPTGDGGFETGATFAANGWTAVNDATNQWFVGTVTNNGGVNGAYVSNDAGVTNAYTITSLQVSHFYRDITFPAGQVLIILKFDWKGQGESTFDRMRIYLVPTSTTPVAATELASGQIGAANYSLQAAYGSSGFIQIPASAAGTTQRLVFSWRNDASLGTQPPTGIDNISLTSQVLPPPFSGAYTINKDLPTAGANVSSFSEAFLLLNAIGVSGPTTITVTGTASTVTYVEGNLTLGGLYVSGVSPSALHTTLSATNTLTFVAGSGKTINMSGNGTGQTGGDFAFRLQGVDYVTFDGINVADTVAAGSDTTTRRFEFGYIVNNASNNDGASNNTIKNMTISLKKASSALTNGPYGVVVANGTTILGTTVGTAGSYASRCNTNKIQNFTIQNVKRGIQFDGLALPAFDEGNEVSGPAFTSAAGGTWVGGSRITNFGGASSGTDWGIGIDGEKGLKVFNVQVDGGNETVAGTAISGIHFGTAASTSDGADIVEIYNCVVRNIDNTNALPTAGVAGIRATATTLHTIKCYNNVVYDLRNLGSAAGNLLMAFQFNGPTSASKIELYNNSVNISSVHTNAAGVARGILTSTAPLLFIAKNNAIQVTGGGSTGGARAVEFSGSPTLIDLSNNIYNVGTTSASRVVGVYGATLRQNLIDWQSTMATPSDGVDQRSAYGDPGFNSGTDLTYGAMNRVNNSGVAISGLSTGADILGVARSASTPDVGAFEGDFSPGFTDAAGAGISITPLEGSIASDIRVLITDNVNTTGNLTAHLWYRDTASVGAFTGLAPDVTPANNNNGEYRWGASLRALAAGTYRYYIVVRDALGNSFADPTMTPGAVFPGFTPGAEPNWDGVNPFAGVGVRTFQNAGAVLAGGTYTVGATGTYLNLTAVANEISKKPLSGNVIFELQSNYTSGAEVFPIVFNQPSYTVTGPLTITVRPAAGIAAEIGGELVTEGNPGGTNNLIVLDGARDITFDGRPGGIGSSRMWRIRNNKDSAAFNASSGAFMLQNDALRNTLKYLNIEATSTSPPFGVVNIGSTFYGGQGNNFNTIDNCDIGAFAATIAVPPNPVRGISAVGGGTNAYNKSNVFSNNLIHDFHATAGSSNPVGIFLAGEVGSTITRNSFYQTAARSGVAALALGIAVNGATGPGITITNNFIGGSAALCGGTPYTHTSTVSGFYGMQVNIGQFNTPSVINGNTITNFNVTTSSTTAGSVLFCGINLATASNQIQADVRENVVGNTSVDATTSPAITFTSASTGTPSIVSGYFASVSGIMNIVGNSIGGVKLLTTSTGTTGFIGIQQQTAGVVARIDSNIIGSVTTLSNPATANNIVQSTNAQVLGIVQTSTAALSNPSITGNSVANVLFNAAAGGTSQTFTGISAAGTAPITILGNTVRDIVGNNHTTVTGISMTSSGVGTLINNNVVRNFTINPFTPATAMTVQGLIINSSASTGRVEKNLFHSLVNGSTSTAAVLYGIRNFFGANWTYVNNMISVGTGSNGDIIVEGISDFSDAPAGGAANHYFNSVLVGGTVTAGTINSYAFRRVSVSAGTWTLRNNIFRNTRTWGAATPTLAFAIGNTGATGATGWAATASNYNIFNTSNDTVGQWLGTTATQSKTLADWQAAQPTGSGGDANTTTYGITFASATDLHLGGVHLGDPNLAGVTIAGITVDFDGATRSLVGPYIGADELPIPTPIQLAYLTAVINNNGRVNVRWGTISEINNYGFEVQKAQNSATNFATIPGSFTPGHGTTNEPQHYAFVDNTTQVGVWYYRLKQIDLNGALHYTEPVRVDVPTDVEEIAPIEFALRQNYPNPFNPSTEIKFSVETTGRATLEVYNLLGQKVATLFEDIAEAGKYYKIRLNAANLASGMYLYRLQSGTKSDLKKMLLLK